MLGTVFNVGDIVMNEIKIHPRAYRPLRENKSMKDFMSRSDVS